MVTLRFRVGSTSRVRILPSQAVLVRVRVRVRTSAHAVGPD